MSPSELSADVKQASRGGLSRILPYLAIARPDHWFKNVFMLVGVVLAYFHHMSDLQQFDLLPILWALASVCIVASSNYVINEILDAPTDLDHPIKRKRPIPSGQVNLTIAYVEWIGLGILGLVLAAQVNTPFLVVAAMLLFMGLVYNIPPVRSKEIAYIDVLTESVNNPLRLAMGWFAVTTAAIPPLSLIVAYWMVGAFFMASKRFAEYRQFGDKEAAAAYRSSFRYYDEESLLVSMFFYVAATALFLGVFIIRYHLELILSVPLIAGVFAMYLRVALKPNSAVQHPERLYRETGMMLYLVTCLLVFLGLMFIEIPVLYDLFNVTPSKVPVLWKM